MMRANQLRHAGPADDTLVDPAFGAAIADIAAAASVTTGRSTVLPMVRVDEDAVMLIDRNLSRYEPVKRLGAGGGGEVLLVKDNDIQRHVALKRLRGPDQGSTELARFLDEIRTVGRLDHPNIVPIHDVGVDEHGRYFFVMKHLRGETLDVIIRRLAAGDTDYHRRFTFEYRMAIFLQVLRAIQFAHAQGILHRDIKPSNIMIGEFGEVVVMDWGIAKRVGRPESGVALQQSGSGRRSMETCAGSLVGTPAYMSPEQARGENDQVDQRSDVYSLCALFYELLTLRHYLRPARSVETLILAVIRDPPVPAYQTRSRFQDAVPLDLWYFVRRGLAKDPEQRHQSVTEMIDLLQQNIEGKVCVQCPITAVKRTAREFLHVLDRHPLPGVLLSLLMLFLIVYGAVHLAHNVAGPLRHALSALHR